MRQRWDIVIELLTCHSKTIYKEFTKINKNNALEIGFGGGRLMIYACKTFKTVYGLDIRICSYRWRI